MSLNMGLFRNFTSVDAILISVTHDTAAHFAAQLGGLRAPGTKVNLSEAADILVPANLRVVATNEPEDYPLTVASGCDVAWGKAGPFWISAADTAHALVGAQRPCHQYLDQPGDAWTVILALDEYDDAWWLKVSQEQWSSR